VYRSKKRGFTVVSLLDSNLSILYYI